jgi:alpha-L-fucosidase
VNIPFKGRVSGVELVGSDAISLEFSSNEEGLTVRLPQSERDGKAPIAHIFKLHTSGE